MSVLRARTTIKVSAFLIGGQALLIIASLFMNRTVSLLYNNSLTNLSIQALTSFYTIKEGIYSLFTKNKKRLLLYTICSLILSCYMAIKVQINEIPNIIYNRMKDNIRAT